MHIRVGRVGARLIRVSRKRGAMTGFKNFVMRGNLVELAVAVVIGTQFSPCPIQRG